MKEAAQKTYGRKGQDIVEKNWAAIEEGAKQVREFKVPAEWAQCEDEGLDYKQVTEGREDVVKFVNGVQNAVSAQEGNNLPVSAFLDYVDGSTPSGSSAYEKRGIAVNIPLWDPANCIQCGRCSYVCPHAVIRTFALTDEEVAAAPEGTQVLPLTGMPAYKFAIGVSGLDCTGCGSCANVCPGKKGNKALTMVNMAANVDKVQPAFDYLVKTPVKEDVVAKFKAASVKGSQFKQPLLEFSGACAGCGETPYAKLITQLFGDRMYIANATGCSSIWGNSSPSTPYTVTPEGKGPAWDNSLFEDNAEFGYGMFLAQKAVREGLKAKVEAIVAEGGKGAAEGQKWLDTYKNGAENGAATDALVAALADVDTADAKEIVEKKDFLGKKSQWIFGGDGWAYDIGYGGVDHVLASGMDVNVMVFDTEVYSNTGGQASKATRTGAVAQFAAAGKETKKKDLAGMAMTYGYVYVAHIAIGADYNQAVKAIAEAEAYDGPSLIIAYAPCINHGIRKGMGKSITEEELAVKAGYWFNFRFNPDLAKEGKNAFSLDSKEPTDSYQDFIGGEVRYTSLMRKSGPREGTLRKIRSRVQGALRISQETRRSLQSSVITYVIPGGARRKACSFFECRNSSDRLYVVPESGEQHHLHRKTQVLPCELSNAHALLISRSDPQCFSHEDGYFPPDPQYINSLSELLLFNGTDSIFLNPEPDVHIIFIEKHRSSPAQSQSRTRNVFLTKMDTFRRY